MFLNLGAELLARDFFELVNGTESKKGCDWSKGDEKDWGRTKGKDYQKASQHNSYHKSIPSSSSLKTVLCGGKCFK